MAAAASQDQLLSCLAQTKELFWIEHSQQSQDEIQRLWTQRKAEIFATVDPDNATPLKSPLSPSPYDIMPPPAQAPLMARATSEHMIKRSSSSTSNKRPTPSDHAMARNSTTGNSRRHHQSSVKTEAKTPSLVLPGDSAAPNDGWSLPNAGPWDAMSRPSKYRRVNPQQGELRVQAAYSPAEYVKLSSAGQDNTALSFLTRSKTNGRSRSSSTLLSTVTRPLPPSSPFVSHSPTDSAGATMTEATTASTEMSRSCNTSANSQFCRALDNVHLSGSPISATLGSSPSSFGSPFPLNAQLLNTKASVATGSQFDYLDSMQDTPDPGSAFPATLSFDEGVSRSLDIGDGWSFIDSTDTGSYEANPRQSPADEPAHCEQPLQPKHKRLQAPQKATVPVPGSVEQSTPAQSNRKMAISKLKQVQTQIEGPRCDKCNKRPQGFRGPHELARHQERDHGDTLKRWKCIEKYPDHPMLANCRHCRDGKLYGAHYNAASHIRRHFARATGKRSGAGSSGGDWPPIDELKSGWIQEVQLVGTETNATQAAPALADDTSAALVAPAAQPSVGTTMLPEPALDFSSELTLDDPFFDNFFDLGNFPDPTLPDPTLPST